MTHNLTVENKCTLKKIFRPLLCLLLFVLAIYFSTPLKNGVIYGFKICLFNIIPTLFPFFILSDLWCSTIFLSKESFLSKTFNISGDGLTAFIIGSLCGFPLGTKIAKDKYDQGIIDSSELEFLSAICNNPSVAFVISGVGAGLFGSIKIGIILYFSVILSAIIIGLSFKPKSKISNKSSINSRQSFNLIDSIKNAGISSITVSSFIIFFSAIIGFLKNILKSSILLPIISAFLEIGSACSIIKESLTPDSLLCLPLISFSLAFSGLSVFFQIFSILPPFVSKKRYLTKKLLQAIISAILTFILTNI